MLRYFNSTIFVTEVLPFSSLGIINPTCLKSLLKFILQIPVG